MRTFFRQKLDKVRQYLDINWTRTKVSQNMDKLWTLIGHILDLDKNWTKSGGPTLVTSTQLPTRAKG